MSGLQKGKEIRRMSLRFWRSQQMFGARMTECDPAGTQIILRRRLPLLRSLALLCAMTAFCGAAAFSQNKAESTDNDNPAGSTTKIAKSAPMPIRAGADLKATAGTPIVTLADVCEGPQKVGSAPSCKTFVTRSEIDSAVSVLQSNGTPASQHQLAIDYSRLAAAAGEAQRRNLDRNPTIMEEIRVQQRLVRLQVLANGLYRQLTTEASDIAPTDIEKYYGEHKEDYAQGEFRRLYIPKAPAALSGQSVDLAILKAMAEDVRKRGASGEDFDALQQDILRNLDVKIAARSTKVGLTSRTRLPLAERVVFDLQPGGVTEVIDSPSAFTILKLESKSIVDMENVRAEIASRLQAERMQQKLSELNAGGKTQFNLEYLELASAPDLLPPPQLGGAASQPTPAETLAQKIALHRATPSRKREVTIYPGTQR